MSRRSPRRSRTTGRSLSSPWRCFAKQEVRSLLREAARMLGPRPWGVGILGFVPPELRAEQLAVVREVKPPFALIAGGRPDQAAGLEREGIATYLHAPSPGLLDQYLRDGARRFVLEGRECGGHVGPGPASSSGNRPSPASARRSTAACPPMRSASSSPAESTMLAPPHWSRPSPVRWPPAASKIGNPGRHRLSLHSRGRRHRRHRSPLPG